jgi:hypothetical protein
VSGRRDEMSGEDINWEAVGSWREGAGRGDMSRDDAGQGQSGSDDSDRN